MPTKNKSSKRAVMTASLLVLLVAGGVTGAVFWFRGHAPPTIEQQLSADSLRDMVNGDQADKLVALATSNELTDEQRELLRRNMMEVMEGEMDRRVNEYWAAAEADRQAVLDRHIDEMVERAPRWMDAMRKMREAEREKEKEANANGDGQNGNGERRERRGGRGGFSKEQQQKRVEGTSAESRMKRMSYFMAAHARATERGVRMPMMHGPGGGWGGGGPGRGPGGPGGPGGGGRGPRN
jgi:uncharacterized membrane protein